MHSTAKWLIEHEVKRAIAEAANEAWWISDQGRIFPLRGLHRDFVVENPKLFRFQPADIERLLSSKNLEGVEVAAISKGWMRARLLLGFIAAVSKTSKPSARQGKALVEIVLALPGVIGVRVESVDGVGETFRTAAFLDAFDR